MSRGPTDAEVMRERARIVTRLQLAIPGAEVDVVGVANTRNEVGAWVIKVAKGDRRAEYALPPDKPVETAVEALRAGLERAGDA